MKNVATAIVSVRECFTCQQGEAAAADKRSKAVSSTKDSFSALKPFFAISFSLM